jgi:hypothetical protein
MLSLVFTCFQEMHNESQPRLVRHIYFLLTKLLATPVTVEAAQTTPVAGATTGATMLTTVPTEQPTPRTVFAVPSTFLPVSTQFFWSAEVLKLIGAFIENFLFRIQMDIFILQDQPALQSTNTHLSAAAASCSHHSFDQQSVELTTTLPY